MRRISLWQFSCSLALLSFGSSLPADEAVLSRAKATLRKADVDTTTKGLLTFFQKRAITVEEQKITQLVQDLGHASFPKRESASDRLPNLGMSAVPELMKARYNRDPEVRYRAQKALKSILKHDKRLGSWQPVNLLRRPEHCFTVFRLS